LKGGGERGNICRYNTILKTQNHARFSDLTQVGLSQKGKGLEAQGTYQAQKPPRLATMLLLLGNLKKKGPGCFKKRGYWKGWGESYTKHGMRAKAVKCDWAKKFKREKNGASQF